MLAAHGSIEQPYASSKPNAKQPTNSTETTLHDDSDSYEWWDQDDDENTPPIKKIKPANASHLPKSLETIPNAKPLGRRSTRKVEKRYSVIQKPVRNKSRWNKKKLQAQAGIQLITDFSARAAPTHQQNHMRDPHVGKFIDLAALDALNGEKKPKEATGGFWRSRRNKEAAGTATGLSNEPRPTNLMPNHDPISALSPMDRPIFIGLTVPSSDISVYSTSPQTASSDTANIVRSYEQRTPTINVPETPSIVITPALEGSTWSPFDESSQYAGGRRTTASSFYSQASTEQPYGSAPPVPKLPAGYVKDEQRRIAAQKSCFSPDSDDGTVWEDETAHTSRVVSSCTIFEEDVSPIISRRGRAVSVTDGSRHGRHASVSTVATRRQSKGWWNYITTPFMTRPSTFMAREPGPQQPPALPSLATAAAAAAAHDVERDQKIWEKQFSPLTPATTTTISSDAWWDNDAKSPVTFPIDQKSSHKTQPSTATIPFFLADGVSPGPRSQNQTPTMASPQTGFPVNLVSNDRTLPNSQHQAQEGFQYQGNGLYRGPVLENPQKTSPTSPVATSRSLAGPLVDIEETHRDSTPGNLQEGPAVGYSSNHRPLPDTSYQVGAMQSNNPFAGVSRGNPVEASNSNIATTTQNRSMATEPQRGNSASSSGTISVRRQAATPSSVTTVQPPPAVVVNFQPSHQLGHPPGQGLSPVITPPPAYSPPPAQIPRYRAFFPPGHALYNEPQQPMSPGPLTPGMQNAMGGSGAMQMSEVPLTPARVRGLPSSPAPVRGLPASPAPTRGPINLNSSYPADLPPRQTRGGAFVTADSLGYSSKAKKAEAKRRRNEKEDAIAHRAGGWWRGRGCIPKNGCYGRKGAEGRKRRRWYLLLILFFLVMVGLAIGLALGLHRKPSSDIQPSQWINVTGFPPIFGGLSTIIAPINTAAVSGCVLPATVWSCSVPKEEQPSISPNQDDQPNFLLNIQWDNSTEENATFANVTGNPNLPIRSFHGNAVSAGQLVRHLFRKAKRAITIVSSPAPPSFAEEFFLGNTTDGVVSANKAGEPTPFYISLLPAVKPANITKRDLDPRQTPTNKTDPFPDLNTIIPPPSLNTDGSAAAATLLPLPTQQPIRLYDRGLPTEHYGFYTYHDRSIFLKSVNASNNPNVPIPADLNGGALASEASFRCTWTQTRFLVQIWTRMNTTARLLNATHPTAGRDAASDFLTPGSFPYPVTITSDRHGGDARTKMIYCYEVDKRGGLVGDSGKIMQESRFFGGVEVNPASSLFNNETDSGQGGFDGGSGGCRCEWDNFEGVVGVGGGGGGAKRDV